MLIKWHYMKFIASYCIKTFGPRYIKLHTFFCKANTAVYEARCDRLTWFCFIVSGKPKKKNDPTDILC